MQMAISRSPEFLVSDDRLGEVWVPEGDVASWNRTRLAATVGIVGYTPVVLAT